MGVGTAIARVLAPFLPRSLTVEEGQPRDGPWPVINPDGWLPTAWGQWANFWQMGYDPIEVGSSAVVQACINAYSQTIAMCPGDHWRLGDNGGRVRITNSALSRVLHRPNDYQSRSDFVLGLGRDLYGEGNTYALAIRNDRTEVTSFHPFDPTRSKPRIADDGSIFYQLAGNNIIERGLGLNANFASTNEGIIVPARDVLHIKLDAKPSEPLIGIPPSRHAEPAIAAQRVIGAQLLAFFGNMSRPSGVLSTELNLSKEQVAELRQRWNEQSKGLQAGGVPILTNNLKWYPMSTTAKDSELAATLKLTQDEIFMVYGVPPAILGLADREAFTSTEALMNFWLARGLGFAVNHIEVAIDHFFGLHGWPQEYCEFDTGALLRVAYKDRIEALARGTISGIFSPDEARNSEDLPKTPFGDEPRVQQQVVPLSAWASAPVATTPRPEPAPPAPAGPSEPEPEPEPEPEAEAFRLGVHFESKADAIVERAA